MDTVVALLSAVARALRGLFDMASMAVGVAPAGVSIGDAITFADKGGECERAVEPSCQLHINPSTGYMQLLGPDMPDIHGYAPGEIPEW